MIRSGLHRNILRSVLPTSTLPSRQARNSLPTQAVLSAPARSVRRPAQTAEYYVNPEYDSPLTVAIPAQEALDPLHLGREMAIVAASSYKRALETRPLWTKVRLIFDCFQSRNFPGCWLGRSVYSIHRMPLCMHVSFIRQTYFIACSNTVV